MDGIIRRFTLRSRNCYDEGGASLNTGAYRFAMGEWRPSIDARPRLHCFCAFPTPPGPGPIRARLRTHSDDRGPISHLLGMVNSFTFSTMLDLPGVPHASISLH
jgi:hypothetical protein